MFVLYFSVDKGENTTGPFLPFAGMIETRHFFLLSNHLPIRTALKRFRYILKLPSSRAYAYSKTVI